MFAQVKTLGRSRMTPAAKPAAVPNEGDVVEAFWPDDETWLEATVTQVSEDGSFRIDPDPSDVDPVDPVRTEVEWPDTEEESSIQDLPPPVPCLATSLLIEAVGRSRQSPNSPCSSPHDEKRSLRDRAAPGVSAQNRRRRWRRGPPAVPRIGSQELTPGALPAGSFESSLGHPRVEPSKSMERRHKARSAATGKTRRAMLPEVHMETRLARPSHLDPAETEE
eukprot:symbB.v1.2.021569.t1/scaffold1869.1/size97865/3